MSVYFLACNDEFVKVGHSQHGHRGSALQTGSPYDLVLLGTMPGDEMDERAIHAELRAYHHRGEWFRLTPDVVRVILAHCHDDGAVVTTLKRRCLALLARLSA